MVRLNPLEKKADRAVLIGWGWAEEREKERGRVSIFWKPVLGCIEADFSIKD